MNQWINRERPRCNSLSKSINQLTAINAVMACNVCLPWAVCRTLSFIKTLFRCKTKKFHIHFGNSKEYNHSIFKKYKRIEASSRKSPDCIWDFWRVLPPSPLDGSHGWVCVWRKAVLCPLCPCNTNNPNSWKKQSKKKKKSASRQISVLGGEENPLFVGTIFRLDHFFNGPSHETSPSGDQNDNRNLTSRRSILHFSIRTTLGRVWGVGSWNKTWPHGELWHNSTVLMTRGPVGKGKSQLCAKFVNGFQIKKRLPSIFRS